MKTLYETRDGRVSNPDFRAFVEAVKQAYTPTDQVDYHHLEIKGSKRNILRNGMICLDKLCGCGGW